MRFRFYTYDDCALIIKLRDVVSQLEEFSIWSYTMTTVLSGCKKNRKRIHEYIAQIVFQCFKQFLHDGINRITSIVIIIETMVSVVLLFVS